MSNVRPPSWHVDSVAIPSIRSIERKSISCDCISPPFSIITTIIVTNIDRTYGLCLPKKLKKRTFNEREDIGKRETERKSVEIKR